MALPKLNVTPEYEVTIPSTRKKVQFRPYLVKEEKILLLAMESKDPKKILMSIADTIVACIDEDIDRSSLTTFDVEYVFMKIRSKSVGEKSYLNITCEKCKGVNDREINIDDIEIPKVKSAGIIELTDKIAIKMKYPSYTKIASDATLDENESGTEQAFQILMHCIESVRTEDENILIADTPKEEIVQFIESMSSDQYKKLTEFVRDMPTLEHTIELDCNHCGEHTSIDLKGIYDFF